MTENSGTIRLLRGDEAGEDTGALTGRLILIGASLLVDASGVLLL